MSVPMPPTLETTALNQIHPLNSLWVMSSSLSVVVIVHCLCLYLLLYFIYLVCEL